MHIGTDSQATEGIVRAGTSRRLAYLRRYQRVSIASLRDVFAEPQNTLFGVRSKEIPADVLTKPLTDEEHTRGLVSLGMALFRAGPPCFAQSAAILAAPPCPGSGSSSSRSRRDLLSGALTDTIIRRCCMNRDARLSLGPATRAK